MDLLDHVSRHNAVTAVTAFTVSAFKETDYASADGDASIIYASSRNR
jgi:hypothetical protein